MGRKILIVVVCVLLVAILSGVGYESYRLAAPYTFVARGEKKRLAGDLDGAIADYNRALAINPRMGAAYVARGLAEKAKPDLDAAIADYTQAVTINPQDAGAYCLRGYAKKDKGDYPGAISDFNEAIELDPGLRIRPLGLEDKITGYGRALEASAYQGRALARRAQGDNAGAYEDLDFAIQFNPNSAFLYTTRGAIEEGMANHSGAIDDFTKAIALDPKNALLYVKRAEARTNFGDQKDALSDCAQAIAIDPKSADAYNVRALSRGELEDFAGAIDDATRAIALNPKLASAYYNRANAKRAGGDFAGSLADCNQGIALSSTVPALYRSRGYAEALMGKWPEALADFRQCHKLFKGALDVSVIGIWLARTELGDSQGASLEVGAALKRPSRNANWIDRMARYLADRITEDDLLEATSRAPTPRRARAAMSDAWLLIGMKHLAAGDKQAAAGYFQKCMSVGLKSNVDYQLAQAQLKALGQ